MMGLNPKHFLHGVRRQTRATPTSEVEEVARVADEVALWRLGGQPVEPAFVEVKVADVEDSHRCRAGPCGVPTGAPRPGPRTHHSLAATRPLGQRKSAEGDALNGPSFHGIQTAGCLRSHVSPVTLGFFAGLKINGIVGRIAFVGKSPAGLATRLVAGRCRPPNNTNTATGSPAASRAGPCMRAAAGTRGGTRSSASPTTSTP